MLPHIDTLVKDWLQANVFPGAGTNRVRMRDTEIPDDVQPLVPLVVVTLSPSSPGDTVITLDVSDLDVDAFAGATHTARDMSGKAFVALRYQLRKTTLPGGVFVTDVRPLNRPHPAPWDSSMIRRWSFGVRVTCHYNPLP